MLNALQASWIADAPILLEIPKKKAKGFSLIRFIDAFFLYVMNAFVSVIAKLNI